jgi:hypothetical protein
MAYVKISRGFIESEKDVYNTPTPYYFLMWGNIAKQGKQGEWRCLVWDSRIKAPVSNIFTDVDGIVKFVLDLVSAPKYHGIIMDESISHFLEGNMAGINRETISWDEIKELYV